VVLDELDIKPLMFREKFDQLEPVLLLSLKYAVGAAVSIGTNSEQDLKK
jgi:hypothetical protein